MSDFEEMKENLSKMISGMTPEKIANIKRNPELLAMWHDSSTTFQALCLRQIKAGANRAEQEELMRLDQTLNDI